MTTAKKQEHTVTRKGTSKNGNTFEFSISVAGMKLNGLELPGQMVQGTLDHMADKIAHDIEEGADHP